jgi:glycosyltransferase involved in cell wall biosynthesis
MPEVSVLMTVYNAMPYLPEAVDSIRRQTLSDWSMIIVNDGSTDDSGEYIEGLDDPRIRVLHQPNGGTAAASNRGLELCRGQFVARLDADDLAMPTRLERQLDFLRRHPEVGLVGTQVAPLGRCRVGHGASLPVDHPTILAHLLEGRHALCHSSIMCRTGTLKEIGGYAEHLRADDWDMFLRLSEKAQLANLDDILLHYRVLQGSVQGRHLAEIRMNIDFVCENARRRRAHLAPIPYEDFVQQRQTTSLWRRARNALDVYARRQLRLAQVDTLGLRPVRGYARLACAAACSPRLTQQRIGRVIAKWWK